MPELLGLDFETYSDVDLPTHGLKRYLDSPNFTPLIARAVRKDYMTGNVMQQHFDFVQNSSAKRELIRVMTEVKHNRMKIVAHNAMFEMGVLGRIGIPMAADDFIDSAVVSRVAGGESKLEVAAPQLTDINKLDVGMKLIKLFSIPGKHQEKHGTRSFVNDVIYEHADEWLQFGDYCGVDAMAGLEIATKYLTTLTPRELEYMAVTMDMNWTGWHVDLNVVREMQRRYLENMEVAEQNFKAQFDAADLNLGSYQQIQRWCQERGVAVKGTDKASIERYRKALVKKIQAGGLSPEQLANYTAVLELMHTKQILGGSSLKKLQVILDTTGDDGRLRDQYLHCGAGQTLRTTGRSVQMQNLKRLGGEAADMTTLFDDEFAWTNDELAANLRQVFTAEDPNGALIVGDFSSVESRGLGWLADASWKTKAFSEGKDLYKVLASGMFHVPYDAVSKDQRQAGKVGELSCGYGAGPGAVREFAAGMGIEMSEAEASKLVVDWRAANPEIVHFWEVLHNMMLDALAIGVPQQHLLRDGMVLELKRVSIPTSLYDQMVKEGKQGWSLELTVKYSGGNDVWLRRYFHGCYVYGRNVRYYRPAERKTGDLWKDTFRHPKTKTILHYELYGGKLAGILTQSFCRELFMWSLRRVDEWVRNTSNVRLIGQFHDEIVLEWRPAANYTFSQAFDLHGAKLALEQIMSDPGPVMSFPLAAEIKHDYRYTK